MNHSATAQGAEAQPAATGPVKPGAAVYLALSLMFFSGVAVFAVLARHNKAPSSRLEVRDSESGRLYGSWPLDEGGEFALEFVHSVNQSPVRESFRREGKTIRPMAVRFFSFGAGMQSDLEEGQTMSRDGGAMILSGSTRSFTELNYIVGTVSDHLLFIGGRGEPGLSLRELCGKNAHITILLK